MTIRDGMAGPRNFAGAWTPHGLLGRLPGARQEWETRRPDPRFLTDHLRRDLGLLDGNDPRPIRSDNPCRPSWV